MLLRIISAGVVFATLAVSQTLTLVSGAAQLTSYGSGEGSQPIVFEVLNGTTPVAGQTITFTNSDGSPATSLIPDTAITNAAGTVSVIFNPAYINGDNYLQFSLEANYGSQVIPFYETSAEIPPAQLTLKSPVVSLLNPFTAKAGQGGTPITVNVDSPSGGIANVGVHIVPIETGAAPPPGTVLQTATCLEAGSTPQGNVLTDSLGNATCTPVFTLPNAALNLAYDTASFKISVGDTYAFGPFSYNISPVPLTISGPANVVLTEGEASTLQVTATGGVPPYAFSLSSTSGLLPGGLVLQSNGDITGSSNTPGAFAFIAEVEDKTGATLTSSTLSIDITGGAITISPATIPDDVVGKPYSQSISVSGGVPPYKLSTLGTLAQGLSAVANPSGLSITISGTPTLASNAIIDVVVTDATGAVTPVPLVNFQVVSPVTVAGLNAQIATIATTYSLQVPISGGLPPYVVTATGLPAGFTINATGVISGYTNAMPGIYPVTVSATDTLGLTASMTFNLELSGGALGLSGSATYPPEPAGATISQPLTVTGGVPPYAFTITATPGQSLTINSAGLLTGTFATAGNQVVAFSVTDATGNTQSFTITIPVLPNINTGGIANSASFAAGTVAPGEIVSLFGTGLGPAAPVGPTLTTTGLVSTQAGGTQVMFGDFPAPILYASAGQLNVVVPFEVVAGQSVAVTVTANSLTSLPLTIPVAQALPGIFLIGGTNSPQQAAVLNQDLSVNGPSNPAAAGSVIVIYATGGGVLSAAVTDGELPSTLINVADTTVTVGGQPATIDFAGLAPGYAGVLQINATLPAGLTAGTAVPIVLTIGTADSSQEAATIAIQ